MTERIIPRQSGTWEDPYLYLMYLRHLAAYRFAQSWAHQRRVLDLGCGTGYGTALIADNAEEVIGLDIALNALPTTTSTAALFVAGDSTRLPLRDQTFDLVISFQVIEHIEDEERYLSEVHRVLTPDGLFIVSTPNKALRLLPFQPPFNPYHVREYDHRALRKALGKHFSQVNIWGLRGIPKIMAIERKRLKKNPLKAYGRIIYQKLLSIGEMNTMTTLINPLLRNRISQPEPPSSLSDELSSVGETFSVEDYWVDVDRIESSLDLIGVCHKG